MGQIYVFDNVNLTILIIQNLTFLISILQNLVSYKNKTVMAREHSLHLFTHTCTQWLTTTITQSLRFTYCSILLGTLSKASRSCNSFSTSCPADFSFNVFE